MPDKNTTVSDLKQKVRAFCEERDWDQFHDIKELSLALSIEASELLEHFRWLKDKEINEKFNKKREEIEDELADILFFTTRIAQLHNIDLTEVFERKLEKNNKKYPVSKSKGSNKKYTD